MAKQIDWTAVYQDGVCPDCSDHIPEDTVNGGECFNCGHVFWAAAPKVTIEVTLAGSAFDRQPMIELEHILLRAVGKVEEQLARRGGTVCAAPESADKLLDTNGNTVGTVRVE
jgi:rubredoxin